MFYKNGDKNGNILYVGWIRSKSLWLVIKFVLFNVELRLWNCIITSKKKKERKKEELTFCCKCVPFNWVLFTYFHWNRGKKKKLNYFWADPNEQAHTFLLLEQKLSDLDDLDKSIPLTDTQEYRKIQVEQHKLFHDHVGLEIG